jgi:biotin operon repressor
MADSLELELNELRSEIARLKSIAADPHLADIAEMKAVIEGLMAPGVPAVVGPAARAALDRLNAAEAAARSRTETSATNNAIDSSPRRARPSAPVANDTPRPRRTSENYKRIQALLARANKGRPGYMTGAEIKEALGLTHTELHTAVRSLEADGKIAIDEGYHHPDAAGPGHKGRPCNLYRDVRAKRPF